MAAWSRERGSLQIVRSVYVLGFLLRLTSIYTTTGLLLQGTVFHFIRISRIFLHHLGLPLSPERRQGAAGRRSE